jgi:ATP-dependent DNA helicase RecG
VASRPEILFPLFAGLDTLDGVGPKTARALAGLDIATPRDLLLTLPANGIDRTRREGIRAVTPPAMITVEVTVGLHRPPARKGRPHKVEVTDGTTPFLLVFFHAHDDWLRRALPAGARRVVSGKLELFDGIAQIVHPDHIVTPEEARTIPPFEPVYPLTQGVTQRIMARAARAALARVPRPARMGRCGADRARGLAGLARRARCRPRARRPGRSVARCRAAPAARL